MEMQDDYCSGCIYVTKDSLFYRKMKFNKLKIISYILFIFCGYILLISCEMTADIQVDHEPVLQVDAVFYNDKPMPVIEIKRSFQVTGRSPVVVDPESLMVNGANVTLKLNGNLISVREIEPGRYLPITDVQPSMGDRIHIEVNWYGNVVSAEARIPDYPVEDVEVTPETKAYYSHSALGHWVYPLSVNIRIPFLPELTSIQTISDKEKKLYKNAGFNPNSVCGCPWEYQTFFKENPRGNSLSVKQPIWVKIPTDDISEDPPTAFLTVPFSITIIIPEPIYNEYIRTRYDEIGAITVTNVDGGVGLFMGALRYVRNLRVDVEVK